MRSAIFLFDGSMWPAADMSWSPLLKAAILHDRIARATLVRNNRPLPGPCRAVDLHQDLIRPPTAPVYAETSEETMAADGLPEMVAEEEPGRSVGRARAPIILRMLGHPAVETAPADPNRRTSRHWSRMCRRRGGVRRSRTMPRVYGSPCGSAATARREVAADVYQSAGSGRRYDAARARYDWLLMIRRSRAIDAVWSRDRRSRTGAQTWSRTTTSAARARPRTSSTYAVGHRGARRAREALRRSSGR
jgi:hypothetical protein